MSCDVHSLVQAHLRSNTPHQTCTWAADRASVGNVLSQVRLVPAFLVDRRDASLVKVFVEEADCVCPLLIGIARAELQ